MESLKKMVDIYGKYIQNLQILKGNKFYPWNIQRVSNVKTSFMNVLTLNGSKYLRNCWRLSLLGSCVFLFQRYLVCVWILEGQSNEPTFHDGDIILVGKKQI